MGLHVHVCMCTGGVNDFDCLAVYSHSLALFVSLSLLSGRGSIVQVIREED